MLRGYDRDSYAERALSFLEKDVCYLAQMNWGYGMGKDDVAQELRLHLWRKLHLYHPGKAGLRTWAQRVMRMRLIDMSRKKKEILDSDRRAHIESEEWLWVMANGARRSSDFSYFPEGAERVVD
jgi:DNA-directed RNA polymerase specialized sigma24 family protein